MDTVCYNEFIINKLLNYFTGLQPFGSGHYVMIKWSQWSETME